MLDDRKQRILQAIIDDYIESGEPVGSKTRIHYAAAHFGRENSFGARFSLVYR
jgi:hypothetical protein